MTDDKQKAPDDEVDAMLDSIRKPDPKKDPAKEIEENGAPDGVDFA